MKAASLCALLALLSTSAWQVWALRALRRDHVLLERRLDELVTASAHEATPCAPAPQLARCEPCPRPLADTVRPTDTAPPPPAWPRAAIDDEDEELPPPLEQIVTAQTERMVGDLRGREVTQLQDWERIGREVQQLPEEQRSGVVRELVGSVTRGELAGPEDGDFLKALLEPRPEPP